MHDIESLMTEKCITKDRKVTVNQSALVEEEGAMKMEKMEEEGLHKLSTHLFLPIIAAVAVLQVTA